MRSPINKCQCITIVLPGRETAGAVSCLLIGHTYGTIINRVRIAIGRIIQIEFFLCKIKPAILIEVLCVVLSDGYLEIPLPLGDHFVIGLSSRSEIIRIVDSLFVIIDMDLW